MPQQIRLSNGFQRLADALLLVRANNIVGQMKDNENFPHPDPALSTISVLIKEFEDAIALASTGNRNDALVKNAKRAKLISVMNDLGRYVLFAAKRRTAIESSGFTLVAERSEKQKLSGFSNFAVLNGDNSGELVLSQARIIGARAYMYQVTPDPVTPESIWQSQLSTVTKNVFKGLKPGQRYWCRVVAVGANNQTLYSQPLSRIVQ